MTTADDSQPNPRSALRRAVSVWGHFSLNWAVPLGAALCVYMLSAWWAPPMPLTIEITYSLFGFLIPILMFTAILSQPIHDGDLCLRCLEAAPLLNPQEAVDRARPRLKLFHNRRRMRLLAAMCALPFLAAVAMAAAGSNEAPPAAKIIASVALAAGTAALWIHSRALLTHRRLHPWCPWCRRRGGGEDTPVKRPVPTGSQER